MKALLTVFALVLSFETFAAASSVLSCKGDDGSVLEYSEEGTLKVKTEKGAMKSYPAMVEDGFLGIPAKNEVGVKFVGEQKILSYDQEHTCNLESIKTSFKQKARVKMPDSKSTKMVTFTCKESVQIAGSAFSDCLEH